MVPCALGGGKRKDDLQSLELRPLGFCHENEQARLFFRISSFPSSRSPRCAAGVSQLNPASARNLGDRLRRRTSWLDIDRISAASPALSPRANSLTDSRAPPSFTARPDRHARLGERVDRFDRSCKPIVGGTRIRPGDCGDGGPRHRVPVVCVRPLRDPPLAAAPGFLSLPGAAAPCAPPPFIP